MAAVLHPCTREWTLAARRWRCSVALRRRIVIALLALVAACVLLSPEQLGAALQWIAQFPLPLLVVFAIVSGTSARARLVALDQSLQTGWWGAAPVAARAVARTMIVAATVAAALVVGIGALVLAALAWLSHAMASLPVLIVAMDAGIALGTMSGTYAALRRRRKRPDGAKREGLRRPMFGLRWLDDARLPHLHDWQRREALLRWRRGGNAWMVGAALFAVPGGAPLLMLPGLLLLTLALGWWLVVLGASRGITREARGILAATAISGRSLRRVALRYPGFALACALAMASAGIACLGMSWRPLAIGVAGALLLLGATLLATLGRMRA